jgi:hypothetical protein
LPNFDKARFHLQSHSQKGMAFLFKAGRSPASPISLER